MRYASALFVPPLLFLALVTVAYAMVPWACEEQHRFPLHLACAAALAIAVACAALAWRNWRDVGLESPDDQPERTVRLRFIAALSLMLSALMSVGIAAVWLTPLILPPCV